MPTIGRPRNRQVSPFWPAAVFLAARRQDQCCQAARAVACSARISLRLLYLGWHPRTACDHRPVLADRHAIAGGNARIPADGKPPLLLLWPVLARARHRLDRCIYHCVLRSSLMSTEIE